jgi:hypothetical protein
MSLYSPTDMQMAAEGLGAACGHGALAALLGIPVVMAATKYLPGKTWVNMPAMEEAMRKAGHLFTIVGRKMPVEGLALIQWEGPWTQPGVPPRVACMHRHWIAVSGDQVWDANLEEWTQMKEWADAFVPELLPPKATGWSVARGYQNGPK